MSQSTSDSRLIPLPDVVKVVSFCGNLYTATGRPLYRYFPLGHMSRLGQTVPWASEWDDYITTWVHTYVPYPRTTSDTPAIDHGGLNYQDRTGAGPGRDYQQATYRGWPLYTCDLDTADFNQSPQGTVPGLFEMVSVCEPPVVWPESRVPTAQQSEAQHLESDTDPPVVGWPNVLNGP